MLEPNRPIIGLHRIDRSITIPTNGPIDYRWASDIDFDGLRLEALSHHHEVLFDISVPDDGQMTINTFGNEIAAEQVLAALQIVQQRH